jgi:hypothetical protein
LLRFFNPGRDVEDRGHPGFLVTYGVVKLGHKDESFEGEWYPVSQSDDPMEKAKPPPELFNGIVGS